MASTTPQLAERILRMMYGGDLTKDTQFKRAEVEMAIESAKNMLDVNNVGMKYYLDKNKNRSANADLKIAKEARGKTYDDLKYQKLLIGQQDQDGTFIVTFENVGVKYNKERCESYIDLPVTTRSVYHKTVYGQKVITQKLYSSNREIVQLSPMKSQSDAFYEGKLGWVSKALKTELLTNRLGYEVEEDIVYFKKPFPQDKTTNLLLKLRVSSIIGDVSNYDPTFLDAVMNPYETVGAEGGRTIIDELDGNPFDTQAFYEEQIINVVQAMFGMNPNDMKNDEIKIS